MLAQVWYSCGEDQRTLRTLETLLPLCRAWGARMLLTKGEAVRAAVLLRMGDEKTARELAAQVWPGLLAEHLRHMDATPPDLLAMIVHTGLLTSVDPTAIAQILADRQPERLHDLLEQLLQHPDPLVRRRTVPLLGRFGLRRGYASLRSLAKDSDASVRELVAAALRELATRPPYPLHVQLFGPLTLRRQGAVVAPADWPREKARQLFALLLLNRDRWLSREQVLEALWPEGDPAAGDGALRVSLNALLNVLEPDRATAAPSGFVLSESAGLRLNPLASISTDLDEWQATLAAAAAHEKAGAIPAVLAAYARLAAIYQDVLLADVPYAEWILDERERRLNEFIRTASRRLDLLLAYGEHSAAIALAEQILRHDPTCDDAYPAMIGAHTARGEHAAAQRVEARRESALC
jgi:DNA-binding SARP family transcriptional activator